MVIQCVRVLFGVIPVLAATAAASAVLVDRADRTRFAETFHGRKVVVG